MPLSRIKTNSIDSTFSSDLTTNTAFSGSYIKIPVGTTAQRPQTGEVGHLRFNTTTSALERYTTGGWAAIPAPPTITGVSPTSFNGASSYAFTVIGTQFDDSTTVKFVSSNGTEYTAGTVARSNSTHLSATTPVAFTTEQEPLTIKVTNGSGIAVTSTQEIDCGSSPTWNTSSGSVATLADKYGTYSTIATLDAYDPDGSEISYTITSGSVPAGMSLGSANGVISGDPTDLETTSALSSFTVSASDGINSTTRNFSITLTAAKDGTATYRAGNSANSLATVNTAITTGSYYINPYSTEAYSNSISTSCSFPDGWMTLDLAGIHNAINGNKSWVPAIGEGQTNASTYGSFSWNGTYFQIGSTSGSNNGGNWNGMIMDRGMMWRAAEPRGWRDWDISFRLSNQWGWGLLRLGRADIFENLSEGSTSANTGIYWKAGTAYVTVMNNSSNNQNLAYFHYNADGSPSTSPYQTTLRNTAAVSESTDLRITLIQGVLKYYVSGSEVVSTNLAHDGTYTGTPVTSSTRWLLFQQVQSPSWVAISSIKVRDN